MGYNNGKAIWDIPLSCNNKDYYLITVLNSLNLLNDVLGHPSGSQQLYCIHSFEPMNPLDIIQTLSNLSNLWTLFRDLPLGCNNEDCYSIINLDSLNLFESSFEPIKLLNPKWTFIWDFPLGHNNCKNDWTLEIYHMMIWKMVIYWLNT